MTSSGSGPVFETFIKEYGERAFQFAYRLTGNVEEAKNLVQEASYRVLKSWDQYDRGRSLDAWFFTILRHVFLDGRKRYERTHVVSLDQPVRPSGGEGPKTFEELLPAEEEAVLERLERDEAVQEVHRALERLAYDHRVVLTLCDMEGHCYDDISQVLDVPVGTVRSRINRARQAFRREIVAMRGEKR